MPLMRQVHYVDGTASPPLPYLPVYGGVTVPSVDVTRDDQSQAMFANANFFSADCRSTDLVGSWVVAVGDIPKVRTADASEPLPVVGLLVAKYTDTSGIIQRVGKSVYKFQNLAGTKRYFLADNGGMVALPLPNDTVKFAQQVGYALDDDDFFVQCTQQVTQRALDDNFVIDLGNADPVTGKHYDATNVWIDTVALAAYFSPTPTGENSVIYAGEGPPTDNLSQAQALFFDDNAEQIYLAAVSTGGNQSKIIVGQGKPDDNTTAVQNIWYFDQSDGELFPRLSGQVSL